MFVPKKPMEKCQSSYDSGMQFYPNMRFAKKTISYNIDNSCSQNKMINLLQAFNFIERESGLIRFYESPAENADITAECNETQLGNEVIKEYFIAGEGGPTLIVNTSQFYVIEKGKVLLFYNRTDCNNYNIELHELLHVFGFDHSRNINSIMYPTSLCQQVVTNDILTELKRLYSIEEKPDLFFVNVSAIKHGTYLDFKAEFKNKGIGIANKVYLEIWDENSKIESFNTTDIGYGEGKILSTENIKFSRNTKELKFIIATEDELNENDNIISFFLP